MEFLQSYKNEIDTAIADFFDNYPRENFSDSEQKLFEGCQYAVMQGGKRIRPILGMMVYAELSNDDLRMSNVVDRSQVIKCLVSLELIHAYSLVHDDLPAMDNDELRRGQPTVWKKYGEAEAILIGDILCTMAFENLAQASPDHYLKKLLSILTTKSGINGMGGGQMRDMDSEGEWSNDDCRMTIKERIEALQILHMKKTGALLVASSQLGAVLAQASDLDFEKISQYAEKIGLAFQIKDDLLDAEGDEGTVGKRVGKDKDSKGFVSLLGIEETKKQLEGLITEAVEIAEDLKSKDLVELARFVGARGY